MTSHYLYATLQAHLTNVNGNGQILFSIHHYRHIRHVHFCIKQVETRFKRGNKMVATDGITQIDEVSQTFTDFFFEKRGPGRRANIM